jgi:predicted ATP-grasp superfamily ATP-dependent carboligase
VQQAGLHPPALARKVADVPAEGSWLSKPRDSCGGGRIHLFHRQVSPAPERHAGGERYFQQYVAGRPCGAVYVAARGGARLLGVTRQLTGAPWANARGFQYAGSIGPLRLTANGDEQFRRLGERLAAEFHLTGLFGVDAIVAGETVRPLEVNPRYTASVEVLERALGIRAIELHAAGCLQAAVPDALPLAGDRTAWCGKAIVYAATEVVIGQALTRRLMAGGDQPWPSFADVPEPGSRFKPGQPVATVFADGRSDEEVETRLRRRAAAVLRWISGQK